MKADPTRAHHQMDLFEPSFLAQIAALIGGRLQDKRACCGQGRQSLHRQSDKRLMVHGACGSDHHLRGVIMAFDKGMQMRRRE